MHAGPTRNGAIKRIRAQVLAHTLDTWIMLFNFNVLSISALYIASSLQADREEELSNWLPMKYFATTA